MHARSTQCTHARPSVLLLAEFRLEVKLSARLGENPGRRVAFDCVLRSPRARATHLRSVSKSAGQRLTLAPRSLARFVCSSRGPSVCGASAMRFEHDRALASECQRMHSARRPRAQYNRAVPIVPPRSCSRGVGKGKGSRRRTTPQAPAALPTAADGTRGEFCEFFAGFRVSLVILLIKG
jgi:hypothetical protein